MKRSICILLVALLSLSILLLPAFAAAGDSKTNPIEIIETTPPDTPEGPPQSRIPSSIADAFRIWGFGDDTPFAIFKRATPDNPNPPGWALVNLICTLLTIAFGGMATGAANQIKRTMKEYKRGKETYIIVEDNKLKKAAVGEPEYVRKSKLWKSGRYDLISAVAAILAFLMTEDIWSPMYLIDKWTPLMLGILAVSFVIYRFAAGGKKLSKEAAQAIMSASETGAAV